MSNQAHKARMSNSYTSSASRKRIESKAEQMAVSEMKNPKLNPTGQMKAFGYAWPEPTGKKFGEVRLEPKVGYSPDARNAARLRGNKERGTQSSSQRKVIK
jgi:hypothetical protein